MAGTFKDHDARATLFHMAKVWLRLADNEDADEVSRPKEEVRPAIQQQQQIPPKKRCP